MPRLRLTRSNARIFGSSMLVVGLLVLCCLQLAAQDSASPAPTVSEAVGFAVSPPLRDLAKLPQPPQYGVHEALPVRRIPKHDFGIAVDPVEQNSASPSTNFAIGLDFLGVGNGFPSYSDTGAPPDTNMAVGDTQIVQWVNTAFAVFNKYNPSDYVGPIESNLLFSALGGPCASDNSDIIAQWDNAAHQWLLAQNVFVSPYYVCVAVSMTADATGSYYLYQFSIPGNGFPDYPKWGRWTNTWAQTMNNFGPSASGFVGAEVCLYERTRLLAGTPFPRQVCHQYSTADDSLLPADIDSPTNPPANECQFFIGTLTPPTQLSLYSACIDWLHPSGATFGSAVPVTVPTYTITCGGSGGACVPQKGTADKLDSLGDRLMYRFAYYNDAAPTGKQHWYVNHDVVASGSQIGIRWYEFQAPKIAILPGPAFMRFQASTYAPDANYRWMGSVAADINNDILAGYSESSSSMYPSIAIAGRLKSDTPGTLEPEVSVVAGTGSQTDTSDRWGDYSAMRIDPDGCTFWYTTEYYMLTASFDWSTQIASARFATCQNPASDGYIELCKQTDPDYPVSGTFNFTLTAPFFSMGPIGVPVGSCSPPIQVPSGIITITEAPQVGVAVENVTAYSDGPFGQVDELDSWTFPQQTATVTVVPGGVPLETVATFTNYAAPPGTLKICKIAGSPSLVGTPFTFTATDGTTQHRDIVNAGPAPGGNCVIDGTWPVNDPVTVTETIPPGVSVSSITVEPPDRGGPPNLSGGYVTVTIGSGFTEVDFTDVTIVFGSCNASSSMSITSSDGKNVVAYVPQGNWGTGAGGTGSSGVAVANIEGSYIIGAPLIVPTGTDFISSCASDPILGQTVCTANQHSQNVYVIQGNPPIAAPPLQSMGKGQIDFTGGCCSTCGVAMDSVNHKAAIGVGIGGDPTMDNCAKRTTTGTPGFQFLDLGPTPAFETQTIPSLAGQISEDWLIDPTSTPPLLLSPSEGLFCMNPPGGLCKPNYEIAKITYPVGGGNTQLQFFENRLDTQVGFPPGGFPDSAAEDCSIHIALAAIEFYQNPSRPYIADLTQACFSPSCGLPASMWSDSAFVFYPVSGSTLNVIHTTPGPIAIAQGGSHEGVLAQEPGTGSYPANTITGFKLNPIFSSSAPFSAWITCNLGNIPGDPTDSPFKQGADPHTLTAYQSPGFHQFPAGHAIAVLANTAPANYLALVDLDLMLKIVPPLGTHVCPGGIGGGPGTLPPCPGTNCVVTFVKVR